MSARRLETGFALALGLIGWAVAAAQNAAEPALEPPRAVFMRIQDVWTAGDARDLARHFGARKISIALPEAQPLGGPFSRSQAYYILKRHFDRTRVLQFEFEHFGDPEQGVDVAAALARRRYRILGDGRVIHDRVLVALALEHDRWVISEIRALR